MAKITLKGNPINTLGDVPGPGSKAPEFKLTRIDLSEVGLKDYAGKRKVLNIFPSVDTPVCATSVKNFNEAAGNLQDTVVLCISKDLPFALKRFCGAENIKNVEALSAFRSGFAKDYKLEITDGPLTGLCSRVVIVLDKENKVVYSEQVPEIGQEPNYEKALQAAGK